MMLLISSRTIRGDHGLAQAKWEPVCTESESEPD